MADSEIEALRNQLRDRGYLSHGLERWFALDPWRSRAFWIELVVVAVKAAVLIGAFGALPLTAIMLVRNYPLTAIETLQLFVIYGVVWIVAVFFLVIAAALLLRIRPELAIDTPGALLSISMVISAIPVLACGLWWYGFPTDASLLELTVGLMLALVFFLVSVIVVSAALLSFSIYELKRIPAIHQKPRTIPITVAAAVLIALLFVPAYGTQEKAQGEPSQIIITPTQRRVALVAVDGLSLEMARSRPGFLELFTSVHGTRPIDGASTAERWASLGTGVPSSLHGVRSVEGVKLPGSSRVLQSVSRGDVMLRIVGMSQPLPPTARNRDYVWEVFANRGLPVTAVNWWTTPEAEMIFAASRGEPLKVDGLAVRRLLSEIQDRQFATVYLPALDVILNRLSLDPSTRVASSIRALEAIDELAFEIRRRGFDIVVVGMPGEGQREGAVIAATFSIEDPSSAYDVAPTLCALLGFPATDEMPGRSLLGAKPPPRVATFGSRKARETETRLNEEYYESLKALGYIR